MKQFTTLDTHDGIGVVDAKDILTDDELNYTVDQLYKVGANISRKYSSAAYHNLDIYQINTTYYSALGNDDLRYFIARRDKDGKHEAKLTLNVKDLTYRVENDGQAVEF